MPLTRVITLLAALSAILPASALATDNNGLESPHQQVLQQVLGSRPDIHDYSRQDEFVTDLLAWQRQKAALAARLAKGESIAPKSPEPRANWHHITGPEDLDTALHNAHGYQQPNYRESIRYNRTTHLSFPLTPLPQQQLSEKALIGEHPVPADPAKEEIPEELLEENARLQREMAASRANLPPPELNRQHFVSHSQLR